MCIRDRIVAFACGKEDENLNKNFKGGRPSSIIVGEELTPKSLGALLAHFENKIMFQGFVWNLNSFDQEGVQLGKVLAKRVLAHDTDGALKVYSDLLNICCLLYTSRSRSENLQAEAWDKTVSA